MSLGIGAFVLVAVLVTATMSGVFGMAGGLLLMGALTLVLPVSAAMVTHGIMQLASNGWRAILHRAHIRWATIGFYVMGSVAASGILTLVSYSPSKAWVYLFMGLVPFITWLPLSRFALDAQKAPQAVAAGFLVTGVNVAAGVSGPLLDIFFVRTGMTRHQVVATKACSQVFAHFAKIVFYGAPLLGHADAQMPPWWVFAFGIPLAMLGAVLGGRILDRMTDKSFLAWTRYIVTAIGVLYLVQAAQLFLRP
jgi:uncharacterized membrane protein YfcA